MESNYIFGAGGHGKVVLDAMNCASLKCAGFIDDNPSVKNDFTEVIDSKDLQDNQNINIHFAIGNNRVREQLAFKFNHFDFFSVKHPLAVLSKSANCGTGNFFAALSIIGPSVLVGNHCIINHHAVVDHDCEVGDFCHIAPHASLGGGVKVGKGVLIGAGAIVLPGVIISEYATVGAGAVVTKNVGQSTTVLGNPAKIYSK